MDDGTFWALVAEVRERAGASRVGADRSAVHSAVVDVLAERLSADEILEFGAVAAHQVRRVNTPAAAAAKFLIEGCVSDDSFMDFRDGLILLGREAFEAAAADPDSLAEHPLVTAYPTSAGEPARETISFESISSCLADAWMRVSGSDDEDDFWDAASELDERREATMPASGPQDRDQDQDWDIGDAAAVRSRLPRLAERFAHRWAGGPGAAGDAGTPAVGPSR